ncbi:MAG TPA: TAXI family TRAP transporter solute-binding subunit [Candidatus Limnocylindria bacterium]|nr:TAXI family TRAP transporter solute-binding subunit [Candidatus Limnocylindria bacterium]
MAAHASAKRLVWQRSRGWAPLVLGISGLVLAGLVAVLSQRTVTPRFTLSAGAAGTTRAHLAAELVRAARAHGAAGELVLVPDVADELAEVNAGRIDFALITGVYHLGPHEHVREVGALYLEALHLLVKEELAAAVADDLGALGRRTVDLGPRGSETEALARMVLSFAQLTGPSEHPPLVLRNLSYDELRSLTDAPESELPDAIFHLAVVPSQLALRAIRERGYRLVPLPFADAMRLSALTNDGTAGDHGIDWQYVTDAAIPPFTYSMRPAVPATRLHTVGSRLLLVANEQVPEDTVALVLEAAFHSRFARIADPPLTPSVLTIPPRIRLHPGTVAYTRRNDPILTADSVDTMNNMLSIVGALVGGGLFLYQWRRQRIAARRDEVFGSYLQRAADIERRLAALELSATLDLPKLIALQRDVLQLKAEALERFAAGDVGSQSALSQLLAPLNTTRDQIATLLLHVRGTLEDRAAEQGRSEQAVWHNAAKGSHEPGEDG